MVHAAGFEHALDKGLGLLFPLDLDSVFLFFPDRKVRLEDSWLSFLNASSDGSAVGVTLKKTLAALHLGRCQYLALEVVNREAHGVEALVLRGLLTNPHKHLRHNVEKEDVLCLEVLLLHRVALGDIGAARGIRDLVQRNAGESLASELIVLSLARLGGLDEALQWYESPCSSPTCHTLAMPSFSQKMASSSPSRSMMVMTASPALSSSRSLLQKSILSSH